MNKKRYYFDYLPVTKTGGVGKRRGSVNFPTLTKAKKEAIKRQKEGRIHQAEFWDASNIFNHKIVGNLNLKGKYVKKVVK